MSTDQLTATSYLILGLLAREGASTPYQLKRHVAATLGNFWTFPHTLLYTEPSRLERLGLLTEEREHEGRHRRLCTITPAGLDALAGWLGSDGSEAPELRDPGLLKLFFADLGMHENRARIASAQLALHQAKLAEYEEAEQSQQRSPANPSGPGTRSEETWRGETLRMGLLYERAAIAFWEGVSTTEAVDEKPVGTSNGT